MSDTTCIHCNRPAFAASFTSAPLCELHLELAIIIMRVKANDIQPTVGAIQQFIRRQQDTLLIKPEDVPGLLGVESAHA